MKTKRKIALLFAAISITVLAFFGCKTETEYVDKTYASAVEFSASPTENGVNVSMSTKTEGAEIYYTTDGTTPTAESTKYDGNAIEFTEDATIMAIAIKSGIENSPVSYAKVSIKEKKITETGEPLSISLSKVVNEAQNDATKTSVTVTATIKSASKIKKVVYKQGGSIDAATLIADKDAIEVKADENDEAKFTFTVTAKDESANGIYTVAALDVLGREETEQITINNFDFSGPERIYANFTYDEAAQTVTVKWTDPKDTNQGKEGFIVSGLKNVTVTYKETGADDTTAKTSTVEVSKTETGENSFRTEKLTPDASYTFTIYSNDNLGNKSEESIYNRKASSSITFKAGDIILADGTKVSVSDYDGYTQIDENNKPVAIIAGFNDKGAALGMGLHISEHLKWASEGTIGYSTTIKSIVCTTDAKMYTDGQAEIATFTGDTDGSDNWEEICKFDPEGTQDDVAEKNYPAFSWANNYGKTYASELGENTKGWYIPSAAELCEVYKNREAVKTAYKKLGSLKSDNSFLEFEFYFTRIGSSSSQYDSENYVITIGFDSQNAGSIGDANKDADYYTYSVVRAF